MIWLLPDELSWSLELLIIFIIIIENEQIK
jgi:hypothetical protein